MFYGQIGEILDFCSSVEYYGAFAWFICTNIDFTDTKSLVQLNIFCFLTCFGAKLNEPNSARIKKNSSLHVLKWDGHFS